MNGQDMRDIAIFLIYFGLVIVIGALVGTIATWGMTNK
jgi:hypothetical protein